VVFIYVYFVIKLQYVKITVRCAPILQHQNDNKILICILINLVENNLRRSLRLFAHPNGSIFSSELGHTASLPLIYDRTDRAKKTLTNDMEKHIFSLLYLIDVLTFGSVYSFQNLRNPTSQFFPHIA
jgi:hypothetical protein